MPPEQLNDALAQLVSAQLIFRRGEPPDAEYTFKHALVQDVAYGTLLRTQRRLMHARITTTVEDQFPDIAATHPELLAHHCEEAGLTGKAIRYRWKAGRQAIARSATTTEAGVQLRKGLSLLASVPEGPERDNHELRLQMGLGMALFVAQGYGVPSAGEAFDRARQLCAELDHSDWLPHAMAGQFAQRLYRAQLRSAYRHSEEFLELGKTWTDLPARGWTSNAIMSVAYMSRGQSSLALGDFAAARNDAENALRLYDPAVMDKALLHGHWTNDGQIIPLMVCIESLTYLGHLDQARQKRDEALARAHQIKHAATLAFVLSCIAGCEAHIEADPAFLLDNVAKLEAFSLQHGFALWERSAKWQRRYCLMALGRTDEAAELLAEAGAELHDPGSFLYKPTWLMSLQKPLGRRGARGTG
jgi:predicted ATPase